MLENGGCSRTRKPSPRLPLFVIQNLIKASEIIFILLKTRAIKNIWVEVSVLLRQVTKILVRCRSSTVVRCSLVSVGFFAATLALLSRSAFIGHALYFFSRSINVFFVDVALFITENSWVDCNPCANTKTLRLVPYSYVVWSKYKRNKTFVTYPWYVDMWCWQF